MKVVASNLVTTTMVQLRNNPPIGLMVRFQGYGNAEMAVCTG